MFEYKRILVLGPCGAGKSFLSRRLGEITKYPVFHLDKYFWKPNWVGTPLEDFEKIIKDIIKENEKFIIDGNYISTLNLRLESSDLVIMLNYDINVCLQQEKERRGKKREDLPDYLVESFDPEFIDYIRSFPTEIIPNLLNKIQNYPNVKLVMLTNKEETEKWLKENFNI